LSGAKLAIFLKYQLQILNFIEVEYRLMDVDMDSVSIQGNSVKCPRSAAFGGYSDYVVRCRV